ncbi:MAG: hypothetical protein QGH66_01755 [Dehalococcoidia bacterium]|nr:hypothetical protein [Dehalococcoidia bacterium]
MLSEGHHPYMLQTPRGFGGFAPEGMYRAGERESDDRCARADDCACCRLVASPPTPRGGASAAST